MQARVERTADVKARQGKTQNIAMANWHCTFSETFDGYNMPRSVPVSVLLSAGCVKTDVARSNERAWGGLGSQFCPALQLNFTCVRSGFEAPDMPVALPDRNSICL